MVKLKGLSGRQVAVDTLNVLYLAEHENDGRLATNVHFSNGQWVTVGLSLDETHAAIKIGNKLDNEKEDDARQLERWRRMAEAKREAQIEIDNAIRGAGLSTEDYQRKSYHVETLADGSKLIKVTVEPKEAGEADAD